MDQIQKSGKKKKKGIKDPSALNYCVELMGGSQHKLDLSIERSFKFRSLTLKMLILIQTMVK